MLDKAKLETEIMRLEDIVAKRESLLANYEQLLLQAAHQGSDHLVLVRVEEIRNIDTLIKSAQSAIEYLEETLEKVSN